MKKAQILTSTGFWVIVLAIILIIVVILTTDWGQSILGMKRGTIEKVEGFKDYDEDGIMNKDDMCCPLVCKTDPELVEKSGAKKGCAKNQKELACDSTAKSCLKNV